MDRPKRDDNTASNQAKVVFVNGLCGGCTPIVHPDHYCLLPWILVGALFIGYDLLVMPYRLCFDDPAIGPMYIFENLVTLYFLIDLVLNFFVGFTTPKGDLIIQ